MTETFFWQNTTKNDIWWNFFLIWRTGEQSVTPQTPDIVLRPRRLLKVQTVLSSAWIDVYAAHRLLIACTPASAVYQHDQSACGEDDKRDYPRHDCPWYAKSQRHGKTAGFFSYGCKRGGAWSIKEAEYHEWNCWQRSEHLSHDILCMDPFRCWWHYG